MNPWRCTEFRAVVHQRDAGNLADRVSPNVALLCFPILCRLPTFVWFRFFFRRPTARERHTQSFIIRVLNFSAVASRWNAPLFLPSIPSSIEPQNNNPRAAFLIISLSLSLSLSTKFPQMKRKSSPFLFSLFPCGF